MNALLGTFVKVGTMADGTPRLTLDMQCTLAELAAMGLVPGVPFALARLEKGATSIPKEPEPEPVKGGALAKLAGMWCNDPEFQVWIGALCHTPIDTADEAAVLVRFICEVSSRSQLDHDEVAAAFFNKKIRLPYMAYQQERTA